MVNPLIVYHNNNFICSLSKLEFTSHMDFIIKLYKEQNYLLQCLGCAGQLLIDEPLVTPKLGKDPGC